MPASSTFTAEGLVETILAEGPLGMAAVARLCGSYRSGKPTHPTTVTRWAVNGVKLADGTVIRLESVRLNGRLVSSRPAFVRFVAAQQGQPAAHVDPAHVRSVRARNRASEEAAGKLSAMGCWSCRAGGIHPRQDAGQPWAEPPIGGTVMRLSDHLFGLEPRLVHLELCARAGLAAGYPTWAAVERRARRLVGPDRVPDGPLDPPLGPELVTLPGGGPLDLVPLAIWAGLIDPLDPSVLRRSRTLSSATALDLVLTRLRRAYYGESAAP